jgi:acyl carrier protein
MDTIKEFIDKITEALEITDHELKPETSFREFPNWSSMNALILIAMFETEYDVTLTGDTLRNCNTVQDLYDLLPQEA